MVVKLNVNGQERTVDDDPQRPLLAVLRERLRLTATKYGCGEGTCGACAVLVDGKRFLSCNTPLIEVQNTKIITIEGLASGKTLHPVQQAFLETHAFQCGYCTAGMIIAAVALLNENPDPTDIQITEALKAHVCRCCSYPRILKAVHRAAELTLRAVE